MTDKQPGDSIAAAADSMTMQEEPKPSILRLEIHQNDWMPGFAAFAADGSTQTTGHATILLNLGAFLLTTVTEGVPKADLPYVIAESIMHEVIHALEEWAGVEFSEERVDALIERYEAAYGKGTGE